jgi:hypothetical protein
VYARDVDGDYVKDVIFASATGNRLGWFEELCATSLPDGGDGTHAPFCPLFPPKTHALTCPHVRRRLFQTIMLWAGPLLEA